MRSYRDAFRRRRESLIVVAVRKGVVGTPVVRRVSADPRTPQNSAEVPVEGSVVEDRTVAERSVVGVPAPLVEHLP